MPDQSWLAVGSDPSGNIFISGHDHVENSMLYRLDETTGMLNWVGDARSASEQVDNWRSTETAEKFHTRPTHYNGRIYVATLDRSSIDGAFYETRGFHCNAFDPADNSFVDLSAAEPDGVDRNTYKLSPSHLTTRTTGSTGSLSLRTRCCTSTSKTGNHCRRNQRSGRATFTAIDSCGPIQTDTSTSRRNETFSMEPRRRPPSTRHRLEIRPSSWIRKD